MNNFIFTVDESAKKELIRQSSLNNLKNFRIKLIVGCAGFKYDFSWEQDNIKEIDNIIDVNDIKILIDSKSAKLINNSTFYFEKSLMSSFFKIDNPQATKTCGCGLSWS